VPKNTSCVTELIQGEITSTPGSIKAFTCLHLPSPASTVDLENLNVSFDLNDEEFC